MNDIQTVISWMHEHKNLTYLKGMERYAIKTDTAFGIKIPQLREFAKIIRKNTPLARELWTTNYHEARMIAVFISKPSELTENDLDL